MAVCGHWADQFVSGVSGLQFHVTHNRQCASFFTQGELPAAGVNMASRVQMLLWRIGLAVLWTFCPSPRVVSAEFWTSAYYPGYRYRHLPPEEIDYDALTHVIHFALLPNTNGTLDTNANVLSPQNCTNLVTRAHAAGKKALISVGGAGATNFWLATSPAVLGSFITNLTNFLATFNYDGIDIDWEPRPFTYSNQFANLVIGLRSALNKFPSRKLLTVAVETPGTYNSSVTADANAECSMFAALQTNFDQINIMTYRLSGAYDGWITWFTGAVFDGGTRLAGR